MPPGRKPSHTREQFVDAAVAFADTHGLSALTLQALGRSLGVSTTAMYRYFRDKDELVSAMREALLAQAIASVAPGDDPRLLILEAARGFRATVRVHPCLGELMGQAALAGENTELVVVILSRALADLGLRDEQLVLAYRQLESFVVGSTVFDFSGAPRHLTERMLRMQQAAGTDHESQLRDVNAVDTVNEAAFEATLVLLVNALTAGAQRGSSQ